MPNAQPFSPPTPRQVEEFLDRNAVRPPSLLAAWLPMLAVALLLGLSWTTDHPLVILPLWIGLLGTMVYLGIRGQAQRSLDNRVSEVQQLASFRHYVDALRLAWRTLPAVRAQPELHGRTLLMMAHCLDHLRQSEAAVIAYDRVLRNLPPELGIHLQLQIQQATTQLAADHLLDADRTLRKLRGRVMEHPNTPISAAYDFACLLQQVCTHHFADAVAGSQDLVSRLRPLGVEAGYGYALLAVAHDKLASRTTPEAIAEPEQLALHAQEARAWWHRATILLAPKALSDRFPQTEELARRWGQPHSIAESLLARPAQA